MHIETEGQVGIGQDAGDSKLEVTQATAGDHYPLFAKHSAGSGVVRIFRGSFTGYAPDDNTSRFITFGDTSATRLDIHADGDVYEGEFYDGEKHGFGVYHYNDGSRYEGHFDNGTPHGKGFEILKQTRRNRENHKPVKQT